MSNLLYKTQCPKCAELGKDRHGDNLAVFDDDHSYCFSCKFYIPSPTATRLLNMSRQAFDVPLSDDLNFPTDFVALLDAKYTCKVAMDWLRQYGINDYEIKKYRMGWSNSQLLLIYPVFDEHNNVIFWQGRNFGEGPKYLTGGKKSDILYKVGREKSSTIIVTEDLISAIKVGRDYQAAPLWGSDMALGLIRKVADEFDVLGVWLDPDKNQKAVEIALRASQYLPTFVIHSSFDPKQYHISAIAEFVDTCGREMMYKEKLGDLNPKCDGNLSSDECFHHTCGVCVEEARNKITKRSLDVEINALFSGKRICDGCGRNVGEIKDCKAGIVCPFRPQAKYGQEEIKYTDPNSDSERPWDYRKTSSGS